MLKRVASLRSPFCHESYKVILVMSIIRGCYGIVFVAATIVTGHSERVITAADARSVATPHGRDIAIKQQTVRIAAADPSRHSREPGFSGGELPGHSALMDGCRSMGNKKCYGVTDIRRLKEVAAGVAISQMTARMLRDPKCTRRRELIRIAPYHRDHVDRALLTRGGGSWFSIGGGEPYDEFPEDFDYDPQVMDGVNEHEVERMSEGGDDGTTERGWEGGGFEDGGVEEGTEDVAHDMEARETFRSPPGRSMVPGLGEGGASRRKALPSTSSLSRSATLAPEPLSVPLPSTKSNQQRLSKPEALVSSSLSSNCRGEPTSNRGQAQEPSTRAPPRSLAGVVLGALLGAVGLRILEGVQRRLGGGSEPGPSVEEHREKIQALEDQLSYLEQDRRRTAAVTKEARAGRRKEEQQLKEYVHTLELHLDQLSREKQEAETELVGSVRAETSKALAEAEERHHVALAAAMEAVEHLKLELQDVHSRLEVVLDERVAGDALLKTEQGRGAALENEVNRLRESASSLTQQLLDAVAKAERAERDKSEATAAAASHEKLLQAEREAAATAREEWARLRGEMESALAEEKERLVKQMEDRIATMRAGLKRRLQEMRDQRAQGSGLEGVKDEGRARQRARSGSGGSGGSSSGGSNNSRSSTSRRQQASSGNGNP